MFNPDSVRCREVSLHEQFVIKRFYVQYLDKLVSRAALTEYVNINEYLTAIGKF